MTEVARPRTLARWLRRHSLTIVAALGGAAGVAYAAGWHDRPTKPLATAHEVNVAPVELAQDGVKDTVQIALLLDTSSSMDGLINQARSHLWNMVDQMGRMTRVVDGKTRGVRVELALYEYGNQRLSRESGYIRQVLPFTSDLDKVSETLHGLYTNGGDEYVGKAIEEAVTKLAWSQDPAALKFVFVAGNEEFDQGPVSAAAAMAAAERHDIHVQLIYCGPEDPTWKAASVLARSDLMTIDQDHVARHVPAPQDDEILRLANELNTTYLAYGADGQASVARQANADKSSAKLGKKVAIERSQLKAKGSYDNRSWDVVDAYTNNRKFLEQTRDDQLPPELRGKSLPEKQQIIAERAAARDALKARIAKLEAERAAFLQAEQAKRGQDSAQSLETEVMKSTKKVATQKGYKL